MASCILAACVGTQKLPRVRPFGAEYYPVASWRIGEEGRALVEFQVNDNLKDVDVTLQEAPSSLRLSDGAVKLIRSGVFDASDRIRPKPGITYRATVIFCLQPGNCDQIKPFPHTMVVKVTHGRTATPESAPSCVRVANEPLRLRPADVPVPTTPIMLLQNIKLAAQSHWFERNDLYNDIFLKALLGVSEVERSVVTTPGSRAAAMPPSEVERFSGHGGFAVTATDGSSRRFQYSFILARARKGELPGHLSRTLVLDVVTFGASDTVPLDYRDVTATFGRGVPPVYKFSIHVTDGGMPPGEEVFYSCSTGKWTETLVAQFEAQSVTRLHLTIDKK